MEYVKLGDLISLVIDYRGKTPLKLKGEWASEGYRALSALNVKTGGLVAEDKIRFVNEDLYHKWMKQEVNRGDILITSEAPFGQVLQWNSDEKIVLSQRLFAIRIKTDVDKRYVYYYMTSQPFQGELKARATGSTVEGLRQPALMKCRLSLPELPLQHRIASILSTYDTLIENNTKRIRLLEKMAENLYKEWFVRFRFPGHENVEMENGLPKGWKRSSLSDVCVFKRGKNITSSEMEEGNVPVISAGLEPSGYHSCSNVKGTNVTMSSSGANAGYIAIHDSDIWAADCSYIEETTTANIFYVYELLNNIRSVINNFQRGAAQPHVYPKDVNRIKLILPSENLMQKANARLEMMHKEIHNLQHQNSLLARQRDLLLPRLISGKLEVKEELLE